MSQFLTLNTVIGNGKSYQVPIYQRDYSWDKSDWEDLWNDILEIPTDRQHYMGYLVLQTLSEVDQTFLVIDGQQRLITISLLSLAVIQLLQEWAEAGLEPEANSARMEILRQRYIGNLSASRLTTAPKLTLNRNNDDFYKSYLVSLRRPRALAHLKPSQRLMQKAFDYFLQQLRAYFEHQKDGATLVDFLERTVGIGLVFTQILVQNDVDAFKVFETLNARGVKLSTADLLKNYLFSQAARSGEQDLEEAERRWRNIVNSLRSDDITVFIRHFWNSRYPLVRQPGLFKAIKREVVDAQSAFALLEALEENASFYAAFGNASDELWDREERKYLRVLNLLEVTTCYSLMLAVLDHLPRPDFKLLLRELSVITFRYNLSGLNPNEAETTFGRAALEVSRGHLKNIPAIIQAIRNLYVPDESFGPIFSSIAISTRRKKSLVKYILVKMEDQLSGADHHPEDANSSIEHILPENPGTTWLQDFPADILDDYIYRLGNYTLLAASENNKLDNNASFVEKKKVYDQSKFRMTREYLHYESWNPESVHQHQQKMAQWAKGIWKSAYL